MAVDFDLSVSHEDHRSVVSLAGELDANNAQSLRTTVADLLDEGHATVVLDLTDLRFLDSSGIGAIVGAHRAASGAGGSLTVLGAQATVRDLFAVTGVDSVVDIRDGDSRGTP